MIKADRLEDLAVGRKTGAEGIQMLTRCVYGNS